MLKKRLVAASVSAVLAFGTILVPAADVFAAQLGTASVQAGVNMRTGPSTSSSVIRLVGKGESLAVLEKTNAYWYKVQDSSGRIGYVSTSSQYLQVSLTGAGTQQAAPSAIGTASVQSGVNMRTSPSTSGSVIRLVSKGESLAILEKPNAYWYKVQDSSGRIGYVSASSQYLQVTLSGGTQQPSTSQPSTPQASSGSNAEKIEKVIATGMKYLGTPYEFGSDRSNTNTFDCSDLVRQMFLEGIGLKLPSSSRTQGDYVKSKGAVVTDWHQLKRGDLLFFMDYKGSKASAYAGIDKSQQRISHCAIYLGNGQILHTYSVASGGVKTSSIAGTHWEYRFVYGGSAL